MTVTIQTKGLGGEPTDACFLFIKFGLPLKSEVLDGVAKRYSNFEAFNSKLRDRFPMLALPKLPGKVWFGSMSQGVVEHRKQVVQAHYAFFFGLTRGSGAAGLHAGAHRAQRRVRLCRYNQVPECRRA